MSPIGNEFHLRSPTEAGARLRSWAQERAATGPLLGAAARAAGRLPPSPFAGVRVDPDERARVMALPPAPFAYALVFTPRSGSSRLGEALASTGRLGRPGEAFNPDLMPQAARRLQATDIASFVEGIRRTQGKGGVWGFEATWLHLRLAFGTAGRFAALARPDAWIWLVREDIVAQAVSVSRMVQTAVAHARPGTDPAVLAEADRRFAYHPRDIALRLAGLRRLEEGSEAMFRALGATPLRLSYERVLARPLPEVVERVAAHLGRRLKDGREAATGHERIGTDKNLAFAARFRAEHPGLVARVERARAPLIEALA